MKRNLLKGWGKLLLACVLGIGINLTGANLCARFELPVFLDTIGTVLVAVLGGVTPGILTGFATNLINQSWDSIDTYYGVLNVFIALVAAYYYKKGFFKKLWGYPLAIVSFALVGGALGSIITWVLSYAGIGTGISAPFAIAIHERLGWNLFFSQLAADFGIDLLDKTICVLVLALVLALIPEEKRKKLYVHFWRQAPLTDEQMERAEQYEKSLGSHSLRSAIAAMLAVATILIAVVVTSISFSLYRATTFDQLTNLAYGVTNVIADTMDPERVDEYIEKGREAEGYMEILDRMADIMASTPDIEFVYAYKILEDGCHVVFDPDTEDVPGAEPGSVIPFDDAFKKYLPALLAGEEIQPVVSNETYGWLLTVYRPIYDKEGVCQCYAAADISMQMLVNYEMGFLTKVISLFVGFFIVILAVSLWLAQYRLILPINTMALSARDFAYDSEDAMEGNTQKLSRLDICTGDEIENLFRAVTKTSSDSVKYITQREDKIAELSRLQNGLIVVLADLVESRDECTGNHVRNTARYTRIIMDEMKKEGIYKDQLTDEFIKDVENMAPLHDVGKISVPDALLNKPGKLTDEEFEIMKGHAAVGGLIIERTMEVLSGKQSGFLNEAKNLANYHHEKWNGTGYPEKLAGEQIPLSARIMAVADVFDALVSKRSYKKGMPFEKAISIIREGAGTHFDPLVAQAFLNVQEQAREVAMSQTPIWDKEDMQEMDRTTQDKSPRGTQSQEP